MSDESQDVKNVPIRVEVPETTEYMLVMVAYKDINGEEKTETLNVEGIKDIIAGYKQKRRAVN